MKAERKAIETKHEMVCQIGMEIDANEGGFHILAKSLEVVSRDDRVRQTCHPTRDRCMLRLTHFRRS